jgi:hypothetical protein
MKSSQNENIILNIYGENEICLNECNIQNENLNDSFQIEQSVTKKIIETNELKQTFKLHIPRKIWIGHHRNAICLIFCVNDD